MKLHPINGRIVVRPLEAAEESAGGIVIPESAREKPTEGEVVAVAEDSTEEVAVGDRVIYRQYGGSEVTVDDERYVILQADDLLGKYVDTDAIPE
jgi:chaperonin GroES